MILFCGTTPALEWTMSFDGVVLGDANRARRSRRYASGKSINAARVAKTMGAEVLAMGFLGGATGGIIRDDMDAAGIAHEFVEVEAETRVCVTMVDEAAGTATELVQMASAAAAGAYEELLSRMSGRVAGARAMVLSGSLPAGGPVDFYARCVELAGKGGGRPVIVDARGPELAAAVAAAPSVVKPNREELAATLGVELVDERAVIGAMEKLLAGGAGAVVVSDGARAVLCADGKGVWRVRPPAVRVSSAIGSGDALAAGMAMGSVDGAALVDAVVLGVACAAANAMTPDAGHVDKRVVEELRGAVGVERV